MARRGLNIYLRKDGRWEGRFVKDRKNGKTHFGYVYGKSFDETKEKLALARSRWIAHSGEEQGGSAMLDAVSADWLTESEAQLKASTVAKYRDYLRCYIHPAFGRKELSTITDADVSGFCPELLKHGGKKGEGLSPKTVSEVLRVLKCLRTHAISRGYAVGYSPNCARIKQRRREIRIFTPAERDRLEKYLETSDDLGHMGMLLCLSTGMRIGELCALTWDDISFEDREIHVRKTLQRISCGEGDGQKTKIVITPPKSDCSQRTIPLPDELYPRLASERQPGAFVLTGKEGQYLEPRTMQNRFKSVLSACSIGNANFHALRHTFSTMWVEKGLDVKSLSAILGHSTVNITLNRYVHPSMAMKRKNMEQMAAPCR